MYIRSMKSKWIVLIIMVIALSQCTNSQSNSNIEAKDKNYIDNEYIKYRQKAKLSIETGDTNLYNEAAGYFIVKSNNKEGFYYYSLLMANKYNYSRAYLDMYMILSHPNNGKKFDELDSHTQRLAKYYLLKSLELSNDTSILEIDNVFSRSEIPSKEEYNNLE